MTTAADELVIEIFTKSAGTPDPYPLFHRLREKAPVHRSAFGLWFASRYADCEIVLRDRRFGRGPHELRVERDPRLAGTPLFEWEKRVMVFADPPDHPRMRRLVGKAFSPKMIGDQRPKVARYVDEVLDRAERDGGFDVITDLSYPLPFWLVADMLGIPETERESYRVWTEARAAILQPLFSDDDLARANAAFVASGNMLRELIAERRRNPGDDLITALLFVEDDGVRLDDDELIANANMLMSAGFETVMHGVGNALLALLRHPDQLAALRAEPSLLPAVITECLRYDNPVLLSPPRMAFVDVDLGGVTVPSGETVLPMIAAANRDPDRFDAPDSFDITRTENAPLSFGGGAHTCLGQALARIELEEAVGAIVRRFSTIELVNEEVVWSQTFNRRGPVTLPVTCAP